MEEYKQTSWSDRRAYRDSIERFLRDDEAFKKFRSSDINYHIVLEHAGYDEAMRCLEHIKKHSIWNHPQVVDAVVSNDTVGGPNTQQYEKFGWVSASTIRYLRILAGALSVCPEPTSIVEVGAGYGGLASLAIKLTGCTRYTMYDLPEAGELQRRFLDAMNLPDVYETACTCDAEPLATKYDLFISTWAFNELMKDTAEQYRKLISKCTHGYVVGVWVGSESLSFEEWQEFVPGAVHTKYEPFNGFDCIQTTW